MLPHLRSRCRCTLLLVEVSRLASLLAACRKMRWWQDLSAVRDSMSVQIFPRLMVELLVHHHVSSTGFNRKKPSVEIFVAISALMSAISSSVGRGLSTSFLLVWEMKRCLNGDSSLETGVEQQAEHGCQWAACTHQPYQARSLGHTLLFRNFSINISQRSDKRL